jgi:putative hydrolase of the HAD superfamily
MLTNIDNVVFDLGGVVVNLERERCIEAYKRLGYDQVEKDLDLYVQSGPFLELECGRITAAEFFDYMRPLCPNATCDKDIEQAFTDFLVDLPVERLAAIRELRKHKRVFALSNTNAVMYDSWLDHAFRAEGLTINDYFEGIIASFKEGCCKPEAAIFHALINRYHLDPARTLFLDDSAANCEAAHRCGLQAMQVTTDNDMIKISKTLYEG